MPFCSPGIFSRQASSVTGWTWHPTDPLTMWRTHQLLVGSTQEWSEARWSSSYQQHIWYYLISIWGSEWLPQMFQMLSPNSALITMLLKTCLHLAQTLPKRKCHQKKKKRSIQDKKKKSKEGSRLKTLWLNIMHESWLHPGQGLKKNYPAVKRQGGNSSGPQMQILCCVLLWLPSQHCGFIAGWPY